jgi:hypothetical protein
MAIVKVSNDPYFGKEETENLEKSQVDVWFWLKSKFMWLTGPLYYKTDAPISKISANLTAPYVVLKISLTTSLDFLDSLCYLAIKEFWYTQVSLEIMFHWRCKKGRT